MAKVETSLRFLNPSLDWMILWLTLQREDALNKGINEAVETARMFNTLCLWSITNVMLDSEYTRNLCWYSFYDSKIGGFFRRKPWHQYVSFGESAIIFEVVKRLTDAATILQQYGIETDTSKK